MTPKVPSVKGQKFTESFKQFANEKFDVKLNYANKYRSANYLSNDDYFRANLL